jgi:hypothetical protein
MREPIENISPTRAQQILNTVARSLHNNPPPELTPDLRKELAAAFNLSQAPAESTTEEDLAKQALAVLAEDPNRRAAVETMAAQPTLDRQKFEPITNIALTAAVLTVLQTHVRFERLADGKYTLKVEKKATSNALLKSLVQKLIAYIN